MGLMSELFMQQREMEAMRDNYIDEQYHYQQWLQADEPEQNRNNKPKQSNHGNSNKLQAHQSMGEGRKESPNL